MNEGGEDMKWKDRVGSIAEMSVRYKTLYRLDIAFFHSYIETLSVPKAQYTFLTSSSLAVSLTMAAQTVCHEFKFHLI